MPQMDAGPSYKDTSLPIEERVADLVGRLTLEEKVSQMLHDAPAIERLDIPAHNWWNECLHGVARAGIATVFPQAIGMAAAFAPGLLHRIARAIADEARAKHHESARRGERGMYQGLTFWSPNINIFRDPRWGRGQETYGEDPYLTGRLGVAFVQGLQGDDPRYLELVATPKHFAAHSGPERDRHSFDARVSPKDLRETYLPAFKECVREGKAASVMGAYNRLNGEPCCGSKTLLQEILRDEWGFDGYVVSDCGAVCDFHQHHGITADAPESAALAVRSGSDLNCGKTYASLIIAVQAGLIAEREIDRAIERLFTARFRLGMFDPPEMVRYTRIPYEVNDCQAHRDLAFQAARKSMVLLKNRGNLLPLPKDLRSVAVIGPNADNVDVLLGNYNGTPSRFVTPLAGIARKVSAATEVLYAKGCELTGGVIDGFPEAIDAARKAEVAIVCLGLSPKIEGEEGDADDSDAGGDRLHLDLPGVQEGLLEAIQAVGKPVVLVLSNGGPLAVNWADDNIPAILEAWYPGEEGGTAIADVLFGDYNPAGRLPVTFVRSIADLPSFEDYDMRGRTYRYLEADPLYPFGYGLSYTTFRYSDLTLSAETIGPKDSIEVSATVENAGMRAGDEVVQLYLSDVSASVQVPKWQLRGFQCINLAPGERKKVVFPLTPRQLALIDRDGRCILEPGEFRVAIGGCLPCRRGETLTGNAILMRSFTVTGEPAELEY